ncbi:heterogeneous nuclear ribonucleoprotein A0 [Drosophila nasuta]|uniref:heterogeneous nuclear ribonucleoprotein A0 n=1 Tax=Drosophila nasuta TaxID=42062 RepID=UPI00295EFE8E|nr:heterogeneous nuclear ribonucleoprotein A0 [Drosophila nasuta]
MRGMCLNMPLATMLLLLLLSMLLLGTHLTEATVNDVDVAAAVDKDVAPAGGVVKTDLLSLEQEIGGNPAATQGARRARFLLGLGVGIGPGLGLGIGPGYGYGYGGYGAGYGWGYPSYGGYYSSPYYGAGYYPYKQIIIG